MWVGQNILIKAYPGKSAGVDFLVKSVIFSANTVVNVVLDLLRLRFNSRARGQLLCAASRVKAVSWSTDPIFIRQSSRPKKKKAQLNVFVGRNNTPAS